MAGFGYRLRRGAGGKVLKSWIVQTSRRAGSSRRMLLGSASVLDAVQARAAAKKLLAKVALRVRTHRRTVATGAARTRRPSAP